MGYGEKKRKIEKKGMLIKRILLGVLLVCLLGLCIFSHFYPPESWKYYVSKPNVSKRKSGELRMHFLDVGQGDCTLIEFPDGQVALIDGGEDSGYARRSLLRTLNALKIKTIDHLILTHTDEDHCGALEELLKYKKIVNAYLPAASPLSGSVYAGFYADVVKKAECYVSSRNVELSVADGDYPYVFTFLLPYEYDVEEGENAEEDNDGSAALWLDYRGVSALLSGDVPATALERLTEDDSLGYLREYGVTLSSTEILKASHHGAADGTSDVILEYMHTETAVISCGAENRYGHPSSAALDLLAEYGVEVYRTDEQENILITVRENGEYLLSTYGK